MLSSPLSVCPDSFWCLTEHVIHIYPDERHQTTPRNICQASLWTEQGEKWWWSERIELWNSHEWSWKLLDVYEEKVLRDQSPASVWIQVIYNGRRPVWSCRLILRSYSCARYEAPARLQAHAITPSTFPLARTLHSHRPTPPRKPWVLAGSVVVVVGAAAVCTVSWVKPAKQAMLSERGLEPLLDKHGYICRYVR